jgi:SAM-dependent methyltransferase
VGGRALTDADRNARDRAELSRGTCSVCGTAGEYRLEAGRLLRGTLACTTCGAILRHRQQADVLLELYGEGAGTIARLAKNRTFRRLDIYEPGLGGPFVKYLGALRGYRRSAFWPDVEPGDTRDGVRCEDLQVLTYASTSFDLVISSEIMEHVREPWRAFAEIRRVLRPGGRHVFTVPLVWPLPSTTIARVDTSGERDVHILEPQYHWSPTDPEGALVYTDFGMDLPELLRDLGFRTSVHHGYRNTITFVARRV